jgi:hypothetical protein
LVEAEAKMAPMQEKIKILEENEEKVKNEMIALKAKNDELLKTLQVIGCLNSNSHSHSHLIFF